jgi:hypothetical protein
LQAAVNAVRAAEKSGDAAAIRAALMKLMPAAAAATAAGGIPRCADPARLYSEYVYGIYAAGQDARSARGLSGLLKAAAPLKGLTTIESQLTAEANRALAKS